MKLLTASFFIGMIFCANVYSQRTIVQIYTDFNGFWTSSTSSNNSIFPNNSHNLLAFKVGNTVYSTGVNDALLSAQNVIFTPQTFVALPLVGNVSSGIIGVGLDFGGNGNVTPSPVINDVGFYLTDGSNGLNIGTAMFNTNGTNKYSVSYINPNCIGDGIPDIIIPQVGDIPNSTDKFQFTNVSNSVVGSQLSANFTSINVIGSSLWKFYSRATPTVFGAAAAGSRTMRFLAYDFADFGITAMNHGLVAHFVHTLSGNSDQPFIAYNQSSIIVLPVRWGNFDLEKKQTGVNLTWETLSEINNQGFAIERSQDMITWKELSRVESKSDNGNSNEVLTYEYLDNSSFDGYNYYRIKQIDFNGKIDYSEVKFVTFESSEITIYPNPTNDFITINGLENFSLIQLLNISGNIIKSMDVNENTQVVIPLETVPSGIYLLKISSNLSKLTTCYKIVKL